MASEATPVDGERSANEVAADTTRGRGGLQTQVETSQQTVELKLKVVQDKLKSVWEGASDKQRQEDLKPLLDEMSAGLDFLASCITWQENGKDAGKVYEALKKYEFSARAFNRISKITVFPEQLIGQPFTEPKQLKDAEIRERVFAGAQAMRPALNVNVTGNPKLDPVKPEKAGEKSEPVELGFNEIKDLADGQVAKLKEVGKELITKPPKRVLKLTLEERTELTKTILSPGINATRERIGEQNGHPIAMLRNFIVLDTWGLYVEKLVGERGKFKLKPAPDFASVITKKPENRVDGPIFAFVAKDGRVPSPEEVEEAEGVRKFLDANWKDVVFAFKEKPGVDLMQDNPDVRDNNQKMQRIYEDARNSSELEAMKKQPFSRTVMSSPVGILLTMLGYLFLDSKDKGRLTKLLIGTFAFEKAGGLPGGIAAYNQLKDEFPTVGEWLDNLTNGKFNLKAKEYTRAMFEKWTGLEGVRQETRDWMLEDSDNLTAAKKMGIYLVVNDLKVKELREKVDKSKASPNSAGSIGEYITQWQTDVRGEWWSNTSHKPTTERAKELVKRLGTEGVNLAGAGEHGVEKFISGAIAGITEDDIAKHFFSPTIKDKNARDKTKPNPMHETLQDASYDGQEFEVALKNKFGGGSHRPAAAVNQPTAAADGKVPPLTRPQENGPSATAFGGTLEGRQDLRYDDSETEWSNATFIHGTVKYHAFRKQDEAGDGLWVEATDANGDPDPGRYSLFFPTAKSFKNFDRTVEIMAKPEGATTLRKLWNDGLGQLPPGSWKLTRFDLPADANIDAKDGWFNVEISTTAVAPDHKLKLHAVAGSSTFQVENSKKEMVKNAAGTLEFDNGTQLSEILKLVDRTAPQAPVAPAEQAVKAEDVKIKNADGKTLDELGTDGMVTVASSIWTQALAIMKIKEAKVKDYETGKYANIEFELNGHKFRAGVLPKGATGGYQFDVKTLPEEEQIRVIDLPKSDIDQEASLEGTARSIAESVKEEMAYVPQDFMKTYVPTYKAYSIGEGSSLNIENGVVSPKRKFYLQKDPTSHKWMFSTNPSGTGNTWKELSRENLVGKVGVWSSRTSTLKLDRSITIERLLNYLLLHPETEPPAKP